MSYYKTRFETTIYPNLTRLWKPSIKPPVNRPIKRPQNLLENVLYFNDGFFSSLLYFERAFPYHINPDPPDSVYVNGLIIGTPELIAWPQCLPTRLAAQTTDKRTSGRLS